jgi:chemotaxis protein MotB
MAGKGGGAWKVAYADFVTAMMAFFLVMWIVGQDKPVKQAVAKYFEDPLGMNKGSRSTAFQGPEDATTVGIFESGRGPARGLAMAQNKTTGRRIAAGVAARRPPHMVIFRHFNRTYSVGTIIAFSDDSAELDEQAKQTLSEFVPQVLGKPNKIEIRVYAPRRPLGKGSPFADVGQLMRARAAAVRQYLLDATDDAQRIRLSEDGALEPNNLYTADKKEVPSGRVEVFVLDEYLQKGQSNPQPSNDDPTGK